MAESTKNPKVESSIGIIIILAILGTFSYFAYSGYKKIIGTQEKTIQDLQNQISEFQNQKSE